MNGMLQRRTVLIGLVALVISCGGRADEKKGNPMVVISTSLGDIKVELYADKAPGTVQNFLDYVRAGYYDGTIFHRVIPGFMIQGGGMTSDMSDKRDGQRPPIKNESSNGLKNETGTLAMARTNAPDSATSQFFINAKDNTFLDHHDETQQGFGYAVFGKVIEGMNVVDSIARAPLWPNTERPLDPVVVNKVYLTRRDAATGQ